MMKIPPVQQAHSQPSSQSDHQSQGTSIDISFETINGNDNLHFSQDPDGLNNDEMRSVHVQTAICLTDDILGALKLDIEQQVLDVLTKHLMTSIPLPIMTKIIRTNKITLLIACFTLIKHHFCGGQDQLPWKSTDHPIWKKSNSDICLSKCEHLQDFNWK